MLTFTRQSIPSIHLTQTSKHWYAPAAERADGLLRWGNGAQVGRRLLAHDPRGREQTSWCCACAVCPGEREGACGEGGHGGGERANPCVRRQVRATARLSA